MISYWITYGTNFIGGTGETQSDASWLVPITIQIAPALVLAIGIMFLPQSPRWLMDQGREEESLQVIAKLRRQSSDSPLVQFEYLELKAQKEFETRMSQQDHPHLQDGSRKSNFLLGVKGYTSLLTNRSNFKRVSVAVLIMTFQQWTGVNFILYYAPFIFKLLGLSGRTTSLLASGVVGIVMFVATIPAVMYLDLWGRKPTLIAGAAIMGLCHFIVAAIIGTHLHDGVSSLDTSPAAAWTAVVFIWIFAIAFGFSWGPTAWVIVSEVFPLGLRAKGVSIGASANWLNNFAVGISTLDFVKAAPYGAYIFLGMICVISIGYVFWFVPETKNRTLDELDELFGDQSGRSKMEAAVMLQAQKDVGLIAFADMEVSGDHESSSHRHHSEDEKKEEVAIV
jgi:sugar porter (SP) family MFS transporter